MKTTILISFAFLSSRCAAQRISLPPITEPLESLKCDIKNYSSNWKTVQLGDSKNQHFAVLSLSPKYDTLNIDEYYHLIKVIKIDQNYYQVDGASIKYIGSTHLKY